jgi:hypothetical protein
MYPKAREDGLRVRDVGGQFAVFDEQAERLHILNETVAIVWRHCDGSRSTGELARILASETSSRLMRRPSSPRWIGSPRQTCWSRCPTPPVPPCHDGGCFTGLPGWRSGRPYPPLSRWRCLAGQHVPTAPRFRYVIRAIRSGSTGTRFRRTSPMATRSADVVPRRRRRRLRRPRLLRRPPRAPLRPRRLRRLRRRRRCRPHRLR